MADHSKAERYRYRAEELLTMAEDFQSPENRRTLQLLAEEYMAMANRLEGFDHGRAEQAAGREAQKLKL